MRINKKEYKQRRSSKTEPFYLTYQWKQLRKRVLERANYLCECEDCKKLPVPKLANVGDHKLPIRLGGSATDMDNLQAMNDSCHNKKSAKERFKKRKIHHE